MKASLISGKQAVALSIAGSDSGGNAGVQADIRAFHAFGVHACTAFAALTAQNPDGVKAIHIPPAEFLADQLNAVLGAYSIGAAKTGMLSGIPQIECVARTFADHKEIPLVVDPVMVATSGSKLLQDDALCALRDLLLPVATICTPNVPEAEAILEREIRDTNALLNAACEIAKKSKTAVLVKGGHLLGNEADAVDALCCEEGVFLFRAPALINPLSMHGTGCSLSAAIAAALALGHGVPEAVSAAKAFVWESIRNAVPVGPSAAVLGFPPDEINFFNHPAIEMTRM